MHDRGRSPWYRHSPALVSTSIAVLLIVLLASYLVWSASDGAVVEDIIVTTTRLTPAPTGITAEVAAGRAPGPEPELAAGTDGQADADESLGWSYTIVPDLLLRAEPKVEALAHLQLAVGTPVELLDGSEAADGYDWVHVRVEDGTDGWIIADGVA